MTVNTTFQTSSLTRKYIGFHRTLPCCSLLFTSLNSVTPHRRRLTGMTAADTQQWESRLPSLPIIPLTPLVKTKQLNQNSTVDGKNSMHFWSAPGSCLEVTTGTKTTFAPVRLRAGTKHLGNTYECKPGAPQTAKLSTHDQVGVGEVVGSSSKLHHRRNVSANALVRTEEDHWGKWKWRGGRWVTDCVHVCVRHSP